MYEKLCLILSKANNNGYFLKSGLQLIKLLVQNDFKKIVKVFQEKVLLL